MLDVAGYYAEHATAVCLPVGRIAKSWTSVACLCQCSRTEKGSFPCFPSQKSIQFCKRLMLLKTRHYSSAISSSGS